MNQTLFKRVQSHKVFDGFTPAQTQSTRAEPNPDGGQTIPNTTQNTALKVKAGDQDSEIGNRDSQLYKNQNSNSSHFFRDNSTLIKKADIQAEQQLDALVNN